MFLVTSKRAALKVKPSLKTCFKMKRLRLDVTADFSVNWESRNALTSDSVMSHRSRLPKSFTKRSSRDLYPSYVTGLRSFSESFSDVDKLFSYPANSHFPYCCEIQSTQKLRELFNFHKAQNPEISCSIKDQRIPVDYIKLCIVDPYIICKNDLYKITKTITKELPEFRLPVKKRICLNERVAFYNEIVHVVQKDGLTLGDLLNRNVVISDHMHDWILGLVNNNLQYQLRRYVRYLKEGTIKPLVAIHNDKITATKFSPLFQDSNMVEDDGFYEQHINELSFDDLSPEGMGWEDIDWGSFNFD